MHYVADQPIRYTYFLSVLFFNLNSRKSPIFHLKKIEKSTKVTERYGIKAKKGIVKVSSLIWVSFLRLQIHLNHEITDFNIISVGASAALLSKVNKCRTFRKNQGFEPEPEPERAKSCKKNRNMFLYILPSVFLRRTTSLSLSSL